MKMTRVAAIVVILCLLNPNYEAEAAKAGICGAASAGVGGLSAIAAKVGIGAAGFTAQGVAGGSLAAGVQSMVHE